MINQLIPEATFFLKKLTIPLIRIHLSRDSQEYTIVSRGSVFQ